MTTTAPEDIAREVKRILRHEVPDATEEDLDRVVRIVARDIAADPEVAAWFMEKVNKGGVH